MVGRGRPKPRFRARPHRRRQRAPADKCRGRQHMCVKCLRRVPEMCCGTATCARDAATDSMADDEVGAAGGVLRQGHVRHRRGRSQPGGSLSPDARPRVPACASCLCTRLMARCVGACPCALCALLRVRARLHVHEVAGDQRWRSVSVRSWEGALLLEADGLDAE